MNDSTVNTANLDSIRHEIRHAIEHGAGVMTNRRLLTELVFLCLIAQENLLFIGPPGTGKSAAARIAANSVGGRYFEYLIGRFTEPSEIFGPLDLVALQNGESFIARFAGLAERCRKQYLTVKPLERPVIFDKLICQPVQ